MTKSAQTYLAEREAKRALSRQRRRTLRSVCIPACGLGIIAQVATLACIHWHIAGALLVASTAVNIALALVSMATFCVHGHLRRSVAWGDDEWMVRDSFSIFALVILFATGIYHCFGSHHDVTSLGLEVGLGFAAFVQVITFTKRVMKWCGHKSDRLTSWQSALLQA